MPDYCTCGAQLPPDALFCHKCGKPQRDFAPIGEDVTATPLQPPVGPPAAPAESPPLDFRNRIAVRTALVVAVSAAILSLSFLPFLTWLAAGFFAVFFYCRRTGWKLNVGSGVRLGWLTGLFTFALVAVVLAVDLVPKALSGQLATLIQEQLKNMPMQDPAMARQMAQFLETGAGLTSVLLFALAGLFLFITGLSMAGGALGAKLLRRG